MDGLRIYQGQWGCPFLFVVVDPIDGGRVDARLSVRLGFVSLALGLGLGFGFGW